MTLLLVGLLIGCQGTLASPPSRTAPAPLIVTPWPPIEDETLRLFDYNPQTLLDIEEVSVTELSGDINHELTYASPKGGRVPATLLVPIEYSGPFAGIILMHNRARRRGSRKTSLYWV